MSTITLFIGPTARDVFAERFHDRDDLEQSEDGRMARLGTNLLFRIYDEDADLSGQIFDEIILCDCESLTPDTVKAHLLENGTINVVESPT